jgi:hypothetical protein
MPLEKFDPATSRSEDHSPQLTLRPKSSGIRPRQTKAFLELTNDHFANRYQVNL